MSRYDTWWRELQLDSTDLLRGTGHERTKILARQALLDAVAPTGFTIPADDGDGDGESQHLTLEELLERLADSDREIDADMAAELSSLREKGWAAIRAAQAAPDADEPVTAGDWAGFTKGRARAWAWNLAQYEPYQFVGPFMALRRARERAIEAGEVPEGTRYGARARRLEEGGLTPETYRTSVEALGKSPFTVRNVSSGPRG